MVTQHGSTTLTIPGHQEELATSGTHTVTMVSADGTQTQPVTIITSGALLTEDSSVASLHHQQVALLATANGTHIAVQVGRGMEGAGEGTERESSGPSPCTGALGSPSPWG